MRDLEIRGAGDLLGAEQSGHVAALGFELYVEMLNEAVAELTGQARMVARPVRVDARVDAYVPAAYIAGRGAQDRPAPPDRARRARGRAARAARRDRGPLRADPRARGEPVPDPGGEARARARGRRLPRLPRRPRHGRPGRALVAPSCARSAGSSRPPSTPPRGRKSRFAPRAWTGRSALAAAIVAARRAA